jgi:tetratricopeptide (TPR) repeat protein
MVFDGWRMGRAVTKAVEVCRTEGVDGALRALGEWRTKDGGAAVVALAEALSEADQRAAAHAMLTVALQANPKSWNGRLLLATLAEHDGEMARAIETYRILAAERPAFEPLALVLAGLELEHGDPARSATMLASVGENAAFAIRHALAKALFAAGKPKEALDVTTPLVNQLDAESRRGVSLGGADQAESQDLRALHAEAIAQTHGAEAITVEAAGRGGLDGRAAVNFTLLAGELMNQSPRIAVHLELKTVAEYERMGEELLAKDPKSAEALCQLGIAALRSENDRRALELFETARDRDPSHFGAMLGSGAARLVDQKGLFAAVRELPPSEVWPGLTEVVPDWSALTVAEQRVVCASLAPLKGRLPGLAAKGARMHLLPLDVRAVDLPGFAELAGERGADDKRSYAALAGVAGHGIGCARIESLLDVSEEGWTFAHEFAHVAHGYFDEPLLQQIEALHERACSEEEEYAFTQYQLSNPFEFFAVAYGDHLARKYPLAMLEDHPAEGVALETRQLLASIFAG